MQVSLNTRLDFEVAQKLALYLKQLEAEGKKAVKAEVVELALLEYFERNLKEGDHGQ